jgi:hypothetical protein
MAKNFTADWKFGSLIIGTILVSVALLGIFVFSIFKLCVMAINLLS